MPVLRPRVFTPFSRPSSSYFPFRLFASFFFLSRFVSRFGDRKQCSLLLEQVFLTKISSSFSFFSFLWLFSNGGYQGIKVGFFFFMKMNFRTIYYSVRKRKRNCLPPLNQQQRRRSISSVFNYGNCHRYCSFFYKNDIEGQRWFPVSLQLTRDLPALDAQFPPEGRARLLFLSFHRETAGRKA